MTLKLAIFFVAIACVWAVLIFAPSVREIVAKPWKLCGSCRLWHNTKTGEMNREPPMMPSEIEYETCPECRAKDL
jgi:hypothetical protein